MGSAASTMAISQGQYGHGKLALPLGPHSTPDGPLTPFPPEIIDCVLDYLDWHEVLSLLSVNSVFYAAIAWRLVNRVRIVERNGTLELEAKHTEPRLFQAQPSLVTKWLPDFVEQLDVYPHAMRVVQEGHSWPRGTTAVYETHLGPSFCGLLNRDMVGVNDRLDLPNFRTLRLFFGSIEGHNVLHTDMPAYEAHALRCRLLPPRRPHTIVLRDAPAKALKHLHTLLPHDYTSRLRRQVHVIGPDLVGEHGTVNGTIYLNWWDGGRALGTLDTCEVVFWTPAGGEWLPIPRIRQEEWSHGLLQRWFDRMLRTLMMSFIELAGAPAPEPDTALGSPQPRNPRIPRLTIVNAGAIAPICYARPGATGPGRWADCDMRQMAVEDAFGALWQATLPPFLASRRAQLAQRVRFVSLDQWVTEGAWRGVFDLAEVGH